MNRWHQLRIWAIATVIVSAHIDGLAAALWVIKNGSDIVAWMTFVVLAVYLCGIITGLVIWVWNYIDGPRSV